MKIISRTKEIDNGRILLLHYHPNKVMRLTKRVSFGLYIVFFEWLQEKKYASTQPLHAQTFKQVCLLTKRSMDLTKFLMETGNRSMDLTKFLMHTNVCLNVNARIQTHQRGPAVFLYIVWGQEQQLITESSKENMSLVHLYLLLIKVKVAMYTSVFNSVLQCNGTCREAHFKL